MVAPLKGVSQLLLSGDDSLQHLQEAKYHTHARIMYQKNLIRAYLRHFTVNSVLVSSPFVRWQLSFYCVSASTALSLNTAAYKVLVYVFLLMVSLDLK